MGQFMRQQEPPAVSAGLILPLVEGDVVAHRIGMRADPLGRGRRAWRIMDADTGKRPAKALLHIASDRGGQRFAGAADHCRDRRKRVARGLRPLFGRPVDLHFRVFFFVIVASAWPGWPRPAGAFALDPHRLAIFVGCAAGCTGPLRQPAKCR